MRGLPLSITSVSDVFEQLSINARKTHTVIMVAHRLTTLNQTDCIFVFDQGRVVEQGAFDDLVARSGVFTELVKSAEAEH